MEEAQSKFASTSKDGRSPTIPGASMRFVGPSSDALASVGCIVFV
jgi:hypothetical protein